MEASVTKFEIADSALSACVHDEAANALVAGRLLEEENGWANLTCAAHLLQTAVRHVLDSTWSVMALLGAS